MTPRFFVDQPLVADNVVALPAGPTRHVQVLRLQPGRAVCLFNGRGGEFAAIIEQVGRREVSVHVGAFNPIERELVCAVTLAVGMPSNERMTTLIEKATELGVACLVPLMCERAVLRLYGERSQKRLAHWRGVAIAACEQSGRTRLPLIMSVSSLTDWLRAQPLPGADRRWVLSLAGGRTPLQTAAYKPLKNQPITVLSGPEGGLTTMEETLAYQHGFTPISLGERTLRADTAPLVALASLTA